MLDKTGKRVVCVVCTGGAFVGYDDNVRKGEKVKKV